MKKISLLLAIFFTCIINVMAFQEPDTIIIRSNPDVERITADLDSLINSYYVQMALNNDPEIFSDDTAGIQYPDSIYESRLRKINSVVNLPYGPIIRNHIHVYTVRQREQFAAVLGVMDYYFPMIEDIFDQAGLPTELKYMAVIESALNPNAMNRRSGATGMWQFMYSTGRMCGLTINSIVDERRSPQRSTVAAAKYIKDLYNIYKDWTLVIAAYNCGPGNVNKAIRRSGNKKDYWEIYYRLPRETRGYIPQYIAAAYAINYYAEHNIRPLPLNIPVATDTIMVSKDIHLTQISEVMKIPHTELRALNPQYKTGLIPGSTKPQALTLPLTHLGDFIDLNDTIINYKPDIYLNKNALIANPAARTTYVPADVKGKTKLIYTVREGDNLGYISEWYRVGLTDLRYWNDIYRNTIRIGQKIAVYVDPSKADFYAKIDGMTFAEKQAMTGKTVTPVTSPVTVQPGNSLSPDSEYITHTVRSGDTIWDIVKLYGNISTTDILTLNNITDPEKIKVGQVLKIKRKS